MKSVEVNIETKTVKAEWTVEMAEDLLAHEYHAIDAEEELTKLLEAELKSEMASNLRKAFDVGEGTFIPETREEMIIDMFNKVLYEEKVKSYEKSKSPGMEVFESFKIPLIKGYGGKSLGYYDDEKK